MLKISRSTEDRSHVQQKTALFIGSFYKNNTKFNADGALHIVDYQKGMHSQANRKLLQKRACSAQ